MKQQGLWDAEGSGIAHRSGAKAGYVLDNMEGAVDRAAFLAKTHMPIAIIGARGTGKMYVARVVHQESGGLPGHFAAIDCREFRNCESANHAITAALSASADKTLVFKYPHLMCADAQQRLARQLRSRTLVQDGQPPRPLSGARFVALLPDSIERLVRTRQLQEGLASVFAGYPIYVPPIRDRQRAVLRWADKILLQECEDRELCPHRFTADAERAMLAHTWEGNISEMRQRIGRALARAEGGRVSPADLDLLGAPQPGERPLREPIVDGFGGELSSLGRYRPSAAEALEQALAEAVHHALSSAAPPPVGQWLEDEIVLAVLAECGGQFAHCARRLHTTSRNIQRWQPRIAERAVARRDAMLWKNMDAAVRQWLAEGGDGTASPIGCARALVQKQLENQGSGVAVKLRAAAAGVSVPTYNKRLKQAREAATHHD
ncbi:sigma 54-interacting transcriptional regulator [Parahaliea mediterranea]|uniref:sigma 54-interacting transcriptional regulator n=1 Tax=Parahaliea mediterranea TaxID=651086 RepID=UPI000E2F379B|nr:sigma 54-interacting transcriptional regulator [Parahaliea mediterranea]